jgi:hypothetical protein
MPKRKERPKLTPKQEAEYANVPIRKEDEAKLRDFLREQPKKKPKKGSGVTGA